MRTAPVVGIALPFLLGSWPRYHHPPFPASPSSEPWRWLEHGMLIEMSWESIQNPPTSCEFYTESYTWGGSPCHAAFHTQTPPIADLVPLASPLCPRCAHHRDGAVDVLSVDVEVRGRMKHPNAGDLIFFGGSTNHQVLLVVTCGEECFGFQQCWTVASIG